MPQSDEYSFGKEVLHEVLEQQERLNTCKEAANHGRPVIHFNEQLSFRKLAPVQCPNIENIRPQDNGGIQSEAKQDPQRTSAATLPQGRRLNNPYADPSAIPGSITKNKTFDMRYQR
jgi:hypothetical protein